LVRPCQHGIAVGVKLRHFEMRVGINEQRKTLATDSRGYSRIKSETKQDPCPSVKIRGLFHFKRAPTGTSSRNPASTGKPLSPTEAATIMPFDSKPRSLRGWRFTTRTTLRPTSDSGA